MVANKVDVEANQRQVTAHDAQEFCRQNGDLAYFEASAKENVNVEAAFTELARKVLKR